MTKKHIFALASEKSKQLIIKLGRLAQLVQSTSLTPRGSGVRVSHRPLIQIIFKIHVHSVVHGFFFVQN